jgi:hypothetical protein
MPISVTCANCGKALKVKDEWAGKRAKCPQCGETFTVPGGSGVAMAVGPTATRFDPNAAATAKAKRQKEAGSVSISWGPIILGICALILCGLAVAFITGPKKVWAEWEKIGDQANTDVIDVVSRGLKAHLSEAGAYNPRKASGPEAKEVMFYRPSFVMNMPESIDFQGGSTEGPFKGKYHPKTGEVEADVTVGAHTSLLTGKSSGGTHITITGRVKGGKTTVEINGKPADIVMPPPGADE